VSVEDTSNLLDRRSSLVANTAHSSRLCCCCCCCQRLNPFQSSLVAHQRQKSKPLPLLSYPERSERVSDYLLRCSRRPRRAVARCALRVARCRVRKTRPRGRLPAAPYPSMRRGPWICKAQPRLRRCAASATMPPLWCGVWGEPLEPPVFVTAPSRTFSPKRPAWRRPLGRTWPFDKPCALDCHLRESRRLFAPGGGGLVRLWHVRKRHSGDDFRAVGRPLWG
jgi:hypothetical protein